MITACCPRCLVLKQIGDQHVGKKGKCPNCKTRFTLKNYIASEHVKSEKSFEDPVVDSPLGGIFEWIDWVYNKLIPPPSPQSLYIEKMLDLVRDDMKFSEDDAKNLLAYGAELEIPKNNQVQLQMTALRNLIQIFTEDDVLDEQELASLQSIEGNSLLPQGVLRQFAAIMDRPKVMGMIHSGSLPVLTGSFIEKPKKDEVLYWMDDFILVSIAKTKVTLKEELTILVTNKRILMQSLGKNPRSIAWDKFELAFDHSVDLNDGGKLGFLAISKSTAKKPQHFCQGDIELAILLMNGVKNGTLKLTGMVSLDGD